MNRGMLFSKKGEEEIPGGCANSAHSATLFKLLRQHVRRKMVGLALLDCKHGCVWVPARHEGG